MALIPDSLRLDGKRKSFLDLSGELRNMVYTYALVPPQVNLCVPITSSRVYFRVDKYPVNVNLFRVSRQVGWEAKGIWNTHPRTTPLTFMVFLGNTKQYNHFFHTLFLVEDLILWLTQVYKLYHSFPEWYLRETPPENLLSTLRRYMSNASAARDFSKTTFDRYWRIVWDVWKGFQTDPTAGPCNATAALDVVSKWVAGKPIGIDDYITDPTALGRFYRDSIHKLIYLRKIEIKIYALQLAQANEHLLATAVRGLIAIGLDELFDQIWNADQIFRRFPTTPVRVNFSIITAPSASSRVRNHLASTMRASRLRGDISWSFHEVGP